MKPKSIVQIHLRQCKGHVDFFAFYSRMGKLSKSLMTQNCLRDDYSFRPIHPRLPNKTFILPCSSISSYISTRFFGPLLVQVSLACPCDVLWMFAACCLYFHHRFFSFFFSFPFACLCLYLIRVTPSRLASPPPSARWWWWLKAPSLKSSGPPLAAKVRAT